MTDNYKDEIKTSELVSEPGKNTEEKKKKTWKERKEAKKEKKRAKKAAKKEAFKALSAKKKGFYIGRRILAALLVAAVIFGIGKALHGPVVLAYGKMFYSYLLAQEVSEEALLEEAPIDRELSEKVDAMEGYGEGDTWAVYVYMCGSNLEGGTMNNLSDFSKYLLETYSREIIEKERSSQRAMLTDYIDDLTEQGMDVPDYMYLNTPMSPKESEEQPEAEPQIAGCSSLDIEEMLSAGLSDKIRIVIQTGGSEAWQMANANPNRSQRFMIDKDGLRLLEDNHFANMGEAETLADFFRFCEKTAPADHKIAVLWNHGAGAFGFASDDLYGGDTLTLKEMRQAFDDVYSYDPKNPAFEIVGFDACLMASLEVAEAVHGYGRYLAASEEVEPGYGWDYISWLGVLSENPSMNGAQVGRAIADSFIDYYAAQNVQLELLGVNNGVTFSVLDINAVHEVYDHYCDLADVMLKDAVSDMDCLVTLARAANRTVRYGTSAYDIFNMIDFSTMIENLREEYPAQTKAIMDDIDRAVVYNRASKTMSGSKGISVYFPAEIPDLTSLLYCLDYIENICPDDSIRALYYYKASGCLNDEMQAYADSLGYGKAQKLDNTALRNLQYGEIDTNSEQFFITLPESAESLIQAETFQLAMLLDDYTVNFGEDELVSAEDGKLASTFDGGWLFMEGNILPLERLGDSAGTVKYRTRVEHNGKDSYMIIAVDEESGDIRILGIYDIASSDTNGTVMAMRNLKNVMEGDKIRIIYDKDSFGTEGHTQLYGPEFTYTANTKIDYEKVRDGKYLATLTMYDVRGDAFYSPVVQYEIKGGKIASIEHRRDFIVSASN